MVISLRNELGIRKRLNKGMLLIASFRNVIYCLYKEEGSGKAVPAGMMFVKLGPLRELFI